MKSGKITKTLFFFGLTILLSACQTGAATQSVDFFSAGQLTSYATKTATPTITPTPVNAPTATPAPTLTPTPQVYVVKGNDTLWTIAAKAGITLQELEDANPGINAYALSDGMELILPAPKGQSGTLTASTPTAIPVVVHSTQCTPSLTGGLYCFALIENQQEFALQNLTAQFTLTDPKTGDKLIQVGLLPLNHLAAGQSLPLFTYFPPPVFSSPQVELQLLSALPVSAEDKNVFSVSISDPQITISQDGYSASVNGVASITTADAQASRFWIAAVAFDNTGNVVGIRQLDKKTALAAGVTADFTMYIYSIAGKIARVELYGEAIP